MRVLSDYVLYSNSLTPDISSRNISTVVKQDVAILSKYYSYLSPSRVCIVSVALLMYIISPLSVPVYCFWGVDPQYK